MMFMSKGLVASFTFFTGKNVDVVSMWVSIPGVPEKTSHLLENNKKMNSLTSLVLKFFNC